jgi:hypothetical protein
MAASSIPKVPEAFNKPVYGSLVIKMKDVIYQIEVDDSICIISKQADGGLSGRTMRRCRFRVQFLAT